MATTVTDPQILALAQAVKTLLVRHIEHNSGQTAYTDAQVAAQKVALQALITAMGGT